MAGEYSAGFQTTALPQVSAGIMYHEGTATGKLPAVMMAATPTGTAEGEELLVWHLRGDGLAVEAPALAGEEVAGVYDLLHLAQCLGVRFADLTRHQPRERLLVVLDDAPDLLYHLRPDRGGDRGPLPLRLARGPARLDERLGITQKHLGHRLGRARRVRRGHAPAWGTFLRASSYHGGYGTGL